MKGRPVTHRIEGPLSGLLVLDLATIFAGPSACRPLGHFGHQGVQLERPDSGGGRRHLGAAFAVTAALRHRALTGQGQVIDISLLESLVDIVGPGPAITHRTGRSDGRIGSRLCFSAPRNIYPAKDGHIVLSGSANQVAL